MAKQKVFKTLYVEKLLKDLSAADSVLRYQKSVFEYDEDEVLFMPNIESVLEQGLPGKMNPRNDYESAKALFLALKDLTPIQAADPRLWTYLSHVDLFEYMTARWKKQLSEATDPGKFLIEHWFVKTASQQALMRNAIASLWWATYLSYDDKNEYSDPFELTKVFFKDLDLPTRTIGTYRIGRHKEAVMGILKFIRDNDGTMKSHYEEKTRFLFKHFNIMGGTKPLSIFDRGFFYRECVELIPELNTIQ